MFSNKNIKYEIFDYEMVHWADDNLFIAHKANKITYIKSGVKTIIEMPTEGLGWKRYFMGIRKLRRLLRLDKAMIAPVNSGLVLFRFGMIYKYDANKKEWMKSTFRMNCRNPMYNGVLGIDGVLYAAEYGNPNGIGKRIIKSDNEGLDWKVVYQFQTNEIRHIHALMYDKYTDRIWIFTGDADRECKVLITDKNFNNVEEVGSGSQEWRACHAIFKKDSVHWIMDSPLKEVHHIKYDRVSKKIIVGEAFAGPVWFAREYGKVVLAASAQEIGPSHVDKKLHLYLTRDLEKWSEIATFDHDGWPKGYFRFGTMTFSRGHKIVLCFEGVSKYDGKAITIKT